MRSLDLSIQSSALTFTTFTLATRYTCTRFMHDFELVEIKNVCNNIVYLAWLAIWNWSVYFVASMVCFNEIAVKMQRISVSIAWDGCDFYSVLPAINTCPHNETSVGFEQWSGWMKKKLHLNRWDYSCCCRRRGSKIKTADQNNKLCARLLYFFQHQMHLEYRHIWVCVACYYVGPSG